MRVRIADKKDREGILKLLDEFSAHLGASEMPSQVGHGVLEEIFDRDDIRIFIAEEENEFLGIATFYLIPNVRHGYKRGHVEDFFVTLKARKQGVGTRIFEAIKTYCKEHDIKVIKLDSGNELTEAHSFYEKHGGKTTERFFRFDL